MFPKNLFPSPSPFDAPLTSPAISTISQVAGTILLGFIISASCVNRSSGTVITPTLGSIVQKGKLAACAFADERQLKSVDFPTLGSPTIPHFNDIYFCFKMIHNHKSRQTYFKPSRVVFCIHLFYIVQR